MPFIILDRDGVINYDSDYYIKSPDEWIPIPGSAEAIAMLNRAGFRVVIATNQSGVARGLYTLDTLMQIHAKLLEHVAAAGGKIEEIFFCPHHPDDKCICRKPQPGLLHQIEQKYDVNLTDTFFIGDSIADIQAAQQVGCKPILVLTGNGKKMLEKYPELITVPQYLNLTQAVLAICRGDQYEKTQ
jgi:D-glycero-D-manno-heptose 1,7-bisphosphate phosphatase